MGFSITFSALLAKIWRLNKVLGGARRFRRVVVTEKDALWPIIAVFALQVVLLLLWTLIDPLEWHRESMNGDESNTVGFCRSEGKASIAFLALLVLLDFSALLLAGIQAYHARNESDEFTESRWLVSRWACSCFLPLCRYLIPLIDLSSNLYFRQLHVEAGFKFYFSGYLSCY